MTRSSSAREEYPSRSKPTHSDRMFFRCTEGMPSLLARMRPSEKALSLYRRSAPNAALCAGQLRFFSTVMMAKIVHSWAALDTCFSCRIVRSHKRLAGPSRHLPNVRLTRTLSYDPLIPYEPMPEYEGACPIDFMPPIRRAFSRTPPSVFLDGRIRMSRTRFLGNKKTAQPVQFSLERKTRFELATFALARRRSTTEPLPHIISLQKEKWRPGWGSNPRPPA